MLKVFYKANSNSLNALKVIKIALVILFALIIAVLPAVRAYALSIEATLLGALAGTVLATGLGAAGVATVVAILIGMGFNCTVSMLYDYFNNPDTAADFLSAWDNWRATHTLGYDGHEVISLSGLAFCTLYDLVKTHIVDRFDVPVIDNLGSNLPLLNPMVIEGSYSTSQEWTAMLNGIPTDKKVFYLGSTAGSSVTMQLTNSVTDWESSILVKNNGKQIWMYYNDENYSLKLGGFYMDMWAWDGKYVTVVQPMIIGTENLYLINGNAKLVDNAPSFVNWNNFNRGFPNAYFSTNQDMEISVDDVQISYNDLSDKIYITDENSNKHILAVQLADGTYIDTFSSYGNFFYYILCTECTLIDTYTDTTVNDTVGSVSTMQNQYYSTSNDIYYNYYNTIAAADTAGTLATGTDSDVKINTSALTSSVAMTDTLTDTAAVTGVESAVSTTTGEVISFSPAVTCMNGINLIRVTTGGIRDKFPFAVVYVLRDSFNVLQAERETPVFTIPLRFNIGQLVSIDEDFTVDLSNLNTVAAIARWGELGALAIALAILTKKMLF